MESPTGKYMGLPSWDQCGADGQTWLGPRWATSLGHVCSKQPMHVGPTWGPPDRADWNNKNYNNNNK